MKLHLNFRSILVGLSLTFTACGQVPAGYFDQLNRTDRPTTLQKIEATTASIQGNWFAACRTDGARPGVFIRESLTYFGQSMTSYQVIFADAECLSELYRVTTSASFSVSNEQITLNYSQLSIAASKSEMVANFNQPPGYCKRTDWVLNIPKAFYDVRDCGMPLAELKRLENYEKRQLFVISSTSTAQYIKQ